EGARPFLERALALRQELGDSIGAGVTNLNLAQTTGSLVSSAAEGQAPTGPSVETPRPGRPAARWRGVAMATAALGLAGGVLFILFPRAPQPVLQTPALAFGEVAVDQGAPARRAAVLENQGRAPLVIRTVTLDGPGANAFRIETNTCAQAPVSPGGACRVDVLFAPSAPGQALAELHLEPEGLRRQTVSLSGTGLQGIASVKPAAVNFGEVLYDVRSASPQLQTVTLTNTGTAPIPLAAPAITGQHAGDFRVVRTTCQGTTLAPGAACTADLAFRPTDKGERTAGLTLGGKAVPLRGEGVRPFATAAPDSLLFSALTTRGGAQEQTVTVTNTGTGHLAISGIRVDGTAAAAFAIARETCTTAPLDPGKTCTVTVRFTPGGQGPYQAQLALQHNGAGMTTVALTGR
ncbi:MAG TPA: choice-of-anchor D domain-containing protein, partial [Symbiobacteriaceae bacterium]|nr:choice-of-anchor D domain-containing protein [Symbiobacteriaceae bacterium]